MMAADAIGMEVDMVREWWGIIWNMFLAYVGDGWLRWGLALVLMIICCMKDRMVRGKFLYPTLILLVVFFNPWFYGTVGIRFMNGMYWRMLWFVPVDIILAYGILRVSEYVGRRFNLFSGVACICLMAALVVLGGSPVISSETYVRPSNYYQLPQVTIEVSDALMSDMDAMNYENVRVAVPVELVTTVRQYTTRIALVYGRNAYGYINTISDREAEFFNEMSKEEPDIELVVELCSSENVRYVVFNSLYHRNYQGIEGYSFEYVGNAYGYDIYKRLDGQA
jgi:hypothetical protein